MRSEAMKQGLLHMAGNHLFLALFSDIFFLLGEAKTDVYIQNYWFSSATTQFIDRRFFSYYIGVFRKQTFFNITIEVLYSQIQDSEVKLYIWL